MNSYHDLPFWSIEFIYYMKLYNTWINILDDFINWGFLQSFHFYVVTSLHSIKLNPLTQPQILKSRHVYIKVCMFLILIVVEVTNKQWMVITGKMDLLNLFILGMEKLEDDKMMNPHCFFTLLSTVVAIHIILMWRDDTTISKLFNISNTQCPYSINFLTRPTNLISCFITKKSEQYLHVDSWKNESEFFDFLETYQFLTCFQTWLPCLWIGTWLPRDQVSCLYYGLYMHQTITPWTDNLSQTGQM